MWKVTACVSVCNWDQFDIPLGVYRHRWQARPRRGLHLIARPWREVRVERA